MFTTFSAEISQETSRNWQYTGIFPEQEFRRTRSVTLHGILGVWHKHACAICVWTYTLDFSWCNELRRTSHHIPWLIGVHATNNVCKLFFFFFFFFIIILLIFLGNYVHYPYHFQDFGYHELFFLTYAFSVYHQCLIFFHGNLIPMFTGEVFV